MDYQLLIDGALRPGSGTMPVINPADETVIANCPFGSQEELDAAVSAAQLAFKSWRKLSYAQRGEYLMAMSEALTANSETLSEILTLEQGKPLNASAFEIKFCASFAAFFANQEIETEILQDDEKKRVEIRHDPIGVVACICPWNYPLLTAIYKIVPALLTGNTIIVKPAPTTPLATLKLGEIVRDIFPPGVINILADNGDLGPKMTTHDGIAKVSFTGSTATGKKIMAASSETLKRMTLELGGNDAAIVMSDAKVDKIARAIFGSSFANSGQVCAAIKRLYVHADIYEDMCAALKTLAEGSVVGDGRDAASHFGPVQNKRQFEKVLTYVADAKENGTIITGGNIPDKPGYFVPLTLVRDIEDGSRLVDEEPFGPVLPIIKFTDIDDVIARANNSAYGLGASVWSSDPKAAMDVAEQLEAGSVWINQHTSLAATIPFPTSKQSGIGVERGREGLLEFTAMRVINMRK